MAQITHFYLSLPILNIGNHKVYAETCVSTNLALKLLLAQQTLENGTVYYTGFQTSGRGQLNATWQSEAGQNVLMSVFLKPSFLQAAEQVLLNMVVSLATNDAIEHLVNMPCYIKWPNDILVADKKIAGILIENVLQQTKIKYSIAGIGININQTAFKNLSHATSVKLLSNQELKPIEVIDLLCKLLEKYYILLVKKHFDKIIELYNSKLYAKNQKRTFNVGSTQVTGIIMGVAKTGRLFVMINDEVKSFANKEITLQY